MSELLEFLLRILGWNADIKAYQALRTIALAQEYKAAIVLISDEDSVPIAKAIHERAFGINLPFIVCDSSRTNSTQDARMSAANVPSARNAIVEAAGGSICVRNYTLPKDFDVLVDHINRPDSNIRLFVSAYSYFAKHKRNIKYIRPYITLPAPIVIPALNTRKDELPKIIDAYARDAMKVLDVSDVYFTAKDHDWVLNEASHTFDEIERATMRVIALNASNNLVVAANRLNMTAISLRRWMRRRNLMPERYSVSSKRHQSNE